jgi:hypothetical protein
MKLVWLPPMILEVVSVVDVNIEIAFRRFIDAEFLGANDICFTIGVGYLFLENVLLGQQVEQGERHKE